MNITISKDRNRLLTKSIPWDFKNPPMDIIEVAESMVNLMIKENGFGLAYCQTDLPGNYSMFAMRGEPENFFFINPMIVDIKGEEIEDLEGCLSFKGLSLKLKRFHEVRLRFSGPDGERYTKVFKGISARVIFHEMQHLNGKMWFEGLISRLKLQKAIKDAKKRGFDYTGQGLLKYCEK